MNHRADTVHEGIRVSATFCNLRQFLFPFRCQHGRGQRLRQDRDKVDTGFCGDQALALAFHKSGCHQLFNDCRPVRRRAKTFRSTLWGISSLPAFSIADRRVSSVNGFGDCVKCSVMETSTPSKNCPSVKIGIVPPSQSAGFTFKEARKMWSISPAFGEDALALYSEGMTAAVKRGCDCLIFIGIGRRTQQLALDQ